MSTHSKFVLSLVASLTSLGTAMGQGVLIETDSSRRLPTPIVIRPDLPLPPLSEYAIQEININGTLNENVAQLQMSQKFVNTGSRIMEVQFVFPLPYDGAISDLTFLVDGKEYEGEIMDAKQARRIYESHVRQTKHPALMEWIGTGLFRTSVFPVPAGAERTVTFRYSQLCRQAHDLVEFTFPLKAARFSAKPIEQLRIDLLIKSDATIRNIYSPSHEIVVKRDDPNRSRVTFIAENYVPTGDFRLFYDVGDQSIGAKLLSFRQDGGDDGYFMLFVNPDMPRTSEEAVAKRILFVVDRSGSMSGKKIEQAKEALRFVVNNLRAGDLFNILAYDSAVTTFRSELQRFNEESREAAIDFVDGIYAGGSTNINAALKEAFRQIQDSDRPNYIVFLTDGLPTAGETNELRIVENVRQQNDRDTRVFSFGVGYDVNSRLLDKLARSTGGDSHYIRPNEDIESHVSRFYSSIQAPVLTNVTIDFELDHPPASRSGHVNRIYPKESQELFAGQQLLLLGRYRAGGDGQVVIHGKAGQESVRHNYSIKFVEKSANDSYAFVARLWATRRVGEIIDEIDLHGKNQELVDELVALAKKHGIVTPYTSFLADDDMVSISREEAGRQVSQAADALLATEGREGFAQRRFKGQLQKAASAAPHLYQQALDEAAGRPIQIDNVRQIGAKTFYRSKDGWLDADVTPEQQQKVQRIERYSNAYFQMIDQLGTRFAKYLAIDEPVTVEFEGQAYSF